MTTVYAQYPPTINNAATWVPNRRMEATSRSWEYRRQQATGETTKTWAEWRGEYPALPWEAEDLIGTQWVNMHTGGVQTVVSYEVPSPKFRPQEGKCLIFENDYNSESWKDTLGSWVGRGESRRYIIEHWLRYDHLTPQGKLEWMYIHIASIQDHIQQSQQQLASYHPERTSCYAANKKWREQEIARLQKAKAKALDNAHLYADEHGLVVPMNLINAGAKEGSQLMLL